MDWPGLFGSANLEGWAMRSMSQFCADNDIRMECAWAPNNPNMQPDPEWAASHWKCALKRGLGDDCERMAAYFSQGSGHKRREPALADVLSCLADDSDVVDYTFEEWCENLGFDDDSRKAEHTYKACLRLGEELREFLGAELLEDLLYETERE